MNIHGGLSQDPKSSIERTITILGKRIQVQYIIAGTAAAITIFGSLLFGEKQS